MMNLILLERIEKLGQMGDQVTVRPGYARNYLLPQKKALRVTKENLAYFDAKRAQLEADNLRRREEAQSVADKINDLLITVVRSASETGSLYGSVSARDIAEAVTEAGATISRLQVVLEHPIKEIGIHRLQLRLHPEVSVPIRANVARSLEEAESQLAIADGRASASNAQTPEDDFTLDIDAAVAEASEEV